MATGDGQLRDTRQRILLRAGLRLLPLHALIELNAEARLAWLRLTRRGVDRRYSASRDLLVNVGCGAEGRTGWVNIDSADAPGVDLVRDCRRSLPLPSNSARGIFTEHFLEHLDFYEEAPRFLAECLRVLQPDGIIRIIVPDGSRYLTGYCTGDLDDFAAFSPLANLKPGDDFAPFSAGREIVPFRTKMEIVNFHFRQNGQHRFSYDFETLARLLGDCGFESVSQSQFRVSRLDELAIDRESRAQESLVVEAQAPR